MKQLGAFSGEGGLQRNAVKKDNNENNEERLKDIDYFTELELARVSLLVAEISGFAGNPLITPPVFVEKGDK